MSRRRATRSVPPATVPSVGWRRVGATWRPSQKLRVWLATCVFASAALSSVVVSPVFAAIPPSQQKYPAAAPSPLTTTSGQVMPASSVGWEYLRRRYRPSGRFLDHGIVEFSVAGGIPERYRIGIAVGLFNHVSIGIAGHWLPGQPVPVIVPQAALRVFQISLFEAGFSYRGGLFPPPKLPSESAPTQPQDDSSQKLKPLFQPRAHYFLGGIGFVHQNVSAGAELGLVYRRVLLENVPKPNAYRFHNVWDGASAFYVRLGNRCAGVMVQGYYPNLDVELKLDLRWPGFAVGRRGCR